MPIFCPAIADSSIGMGLSQGRHKRPGSGHIDVIGDIVESANLVIRRPRTATVVLGGGTPKNFINQASVQAEFFSPAVGGHKYALQIVTDVPHFGGASGSTLEEAQSWGKLASRCRAGDGSCRRDDRAPDSRDGARAQLGRAGQTARRGRLSIPGQREMLIDGMPISRDTFRGDRMKRPIEYDHIEPLAFGGTLPEPATFETRKGGHSAGPAREHDVVRERHAQRPAGDSRRLVPHGAVGRGNRTPTSIPSASTRCPRWSCRSTTWPTSWPRSAASPPRSSSTTSFRSSWAASTRSPRRSWPRWPRSIRALSVLQIDAHADLRDTYMGTPFNHACAMRRVLEHARCTQVGIRSMSTEEAKAAPTLPTEIFYDVNMRQDTNWIDQVVESLGETVYITIDCDGLDPAIMPATGTPEPGGLSWYEMLSLLRAVISARNVVGCDLVELSPLPGIAAPNFLCAKLIYKILTYQFTDTRCSEISSRQSQSRVTVSVETLSLSTVERLYATLS